MCIINFCIYLILGNSYRNRMSFCFTSSPCILSAWICRLIVSIWIFFYILLLNFRKDIW